MSRPVAEPDGQAGATIAVPGHRSPQSVTRARIRLIWTLLVINALGSPGGATIVPIPKQLLQIITMGSLGVAFALALLINPRLRIRINALLLLLTLLLVVSISSSLTLESGLGALFRCARLAVFIATLWLITPWWDDGWHFVKYHLQALTAILGTVVLGLVVAPGMAMPGNFDNRLIGIVWPIAATQVADYATVVAGLTVVLWLAGRTTARNVVVLALPATVLLLLTHTRTATIGLLAGLVVATLALARTSARLRGRISLAALAAVAIALAFVGPITDWLARGQDDEALSDLTGRQLVWDRLLALQRPPGQLLIGVGLTDKSYGGKPIDSTWLSAYYEQGLIGVGIVGFILLTLIFAVLTRPVSREARACSIFLITYGVIASYTQTGLGDASGYLLHVVVAALLLTEPHPRSPSETWGRHVTDGQG